jgi:hypothetical protein
VNNGGAIYNEQGTVTVAGSGLFSNNEADSGNGGAIWNNDELYLTAGGSQAITFENNTADNSDNDIYNTTDGKIYINGAGTVNIDSGIAGEGEINKSASGILNINADSADITGYFVQTAGTTVVSAEFFEGDKNIAGGNTIKGGELDFVTGGSMNGGTLDITADTFAQTSSTVNFLNDSELNDTAAAISAGQLNFTSQASMNNGTLGITGGTVTFNSDGVDASTMNDVDVTQSAGTLNIVNGASMNAGTLALSGGTVNISNGSVLADVTVTQTDGTLDFYSGGSFDGGSLDISGGTTQFRTGSEFTDGKLTQTGGTLNWAGVKLSDAQVDITGGNLNISDNSTLTLNNLSDTIGTGAVVNLYTGSTINNSAGTVTLDSADTYNGSIVNASSLTLDGLTKDFNSTTAEFSQTDSTAELNLTNGSQITTGTNSTITAGDVNIGNGTTGSQLTVGTSSTIGTAVNVNIDADNTFKVNGGSATLDSSDTLNGTVELATGNLHFDDAANNGIVIAEGGNLYIDAGSLYLNIDSSIAAATHTEIAAATNLNLNTGSTATIDNTDLWDGNINVAGGKLILDNFSNYKVQRDPVTDEVIIDPVTGRPAIDTTVETNLTLTSGTLALNNTQFVYTDTVNLNNPNMEIYNGSTFYLANTSAFNAFGDVTVNNGTIDVMNGNPATYTMNTLTVDTIANFKIDVAGQPLDYDKFLIGDIEGNGIINVSDFRVLSAPTASDIDLFLFQVTGGDYGSVDFTESAGVIHTGIYDYHLTPDIANPGHYKMFRAGGDNDFNSQTFRGQAAAMAMLNNQLLVNNMLFDHVYLDSNEMSQLVQRQNQYAAILPQFAPYQFAKKDGSIWFKNYVSFENISMTHNLNVNNNVYGTLVGADFPVKDLKNGWKFLPTAYIGYNGAHQTFNGVSMYQNGGQGGFMGTFNKGQFIGSLLAYAGGYSNEMSVAGVQDQTGNWFAGAAAKGAYNFRPTRNLIIQPNLLASYNAFGKQNWNTQFGQIGMSTGMLNGINVAPGLNLIYGKESWSVYLTTQYMYNINDSISGRAGGVTLPDVSMRHGWIEYGVGATKTWKDRLSSYIQITMRNGGRTGVGFQLGLSWKF